MYKQICTTVKRSVSGTVIQELLVTESATVRSAS
jgi:hypothetical protein